MGKAYRVKINVHNQEPDSLQWTKEPIGAGFTSGTLIKQKAVYANDKIYVFGTTQNGKQVVEYTSVQTERLEHHGQQLICLMLQILTLQHFAKVIFTSS